MLKVTLLKNVHENEDDARKLLPYIRESNVFSLEGAFMSATEATFSVEEWKKMLRLSRTKVINILRKISTRQESTESESLYQIKLHDYLYLNQKPIWYLERWEEDEANKLREASFIMHKKLFEAFQQLSKGRIDEFLESSREGVHMLVMESHKRDRHIGENISSSEEGIRNTYQELRSNYTINLAVALGGTHSPEIPRDMDVKIVDLMGTSEKDRAIAVLDRRLNLQKNASDHSPRDLLAFMISHMAHVYRGALYQKITAVEIESASFEKLMEIVNKGGILASPLLRAGSS